MSVWSTKYLGKNRDYVVIKHNLRGVNIVVQGVKFRGGFAVVEKDSKTYSMLRKFPNLRNSPEFPLTFLKKLPFITRSRDIITVYGKDVYLHYIKAVNKEKEDHDKAVIEQKLAYDAEQKHKRESELVEKQKLIEEKKLLEEKLAKADKEEIKDLTKALSHIEDKKQELSTKCSFRTINGELCKMDVLEVSPSGYCKAHLLKDPKLSEYGIEIPPFMTKQDKKELKEKIIKILKKNNK